MSLNVNRISPASGFESGGSKFAVKSKSGREVVASPPGAATPEICLAASTPAHLNMIKSPDFLTQPIKPSSSQVFNLLYPYISTATRPSAVSPGPRRPADMDVKRISSPPVPQVASSPQNVHIPLSFEATSPVSFERASLSFDSQAGRGQRVHFDSRLKLTHHSPESEVVSTTTQHSRQHSYPMYKLPPVVEHSSSQDKSHLTPSAAVMRPPKSPTARRDLSRDATNQQPQKPQVSKHQSV